MDPKDLLIKSAEALEGLSAKAAELEKAVATKTAELTKLAQSIADAKVEADKASAKAEAAKADVAKLAKTAADQALKAGLIANEERRDEFAAKLMDSGYALDALAKIASKVSAPAHSKVVPRQAKTAETADDVWHKHIQNASNTLGQR
jgi:hypothetical protein